MGMASCISLRLVIPSPLVIHRYSPPVSILLNRLSQLTGILRNTTKYTIFDDLETGFHHHRHFINCYDLTQGRINDIGARRDN